MHEPRRRFALFGQHFSAPAERGTRTAQACSSLTDGEFFAEIQRGVALCGAREIAAPAAGTAPYPRRWAKRKGHLRFPFLFELLPFPCFLIWRRFPICDRSEIRGTAEDFFFRVFRNLFAVPDTALLHMRFTLRRRDIPVSRKSFSRYSAQHLRVLIDNKCYRRVRRPRRTVSNGWYNLSRRGEQCSPTPRQITRYENRLHLIKKWRMENPYGNSPFSIFHSQFFSMSRNTFGK